MVVAKQRRPTVARPPIPGLLDQQRIVAILRHVEPSLAVEATEALVTGGVACLEVALNSPSALAMLSAIHEHFADRVSLGAGTVLDTKDAEAAIKAGARFIVSPHTRSSLISAMANRGIPCIPGALTASEVVVAWDAQATLVKLFPAASVGPGYLRDLRGPFGHIPFLPTGGITLENAASFFAAGAWGLGVGSALANPEAIRGRKFTELRERAAAFAKIGRDARGHP